MGVHSIKKADIAASVKTTTQNSFPAILQFFNPFLKKSNKTENVFKVFTRIDRLPAYDRIRVGWAKLWPDKTGTRMPAKGRTRPAGQDNRPIAG
jgi:hypothetical protein